MIRTIGNVPASDQYEPSSFEEFVAWMSFQESYQLDVETNVTDYVKERKLRTIQFGEVSTDYDKIQYVLVWADLTKQQKIKVFSLLQDKSKRKYIHNASFEYQTFLNYNLVIDNVYDTMIVEKIIYTGHNNYNDEDGNRFFSLAGMLKRRIGISLDKELQTGFDPDVELTPEHILYAAQDVQYLDIAAVQQQETIDEHSLQNVVDLENEVCLSLAEIEYNGMMMDPDAWRANLDTVQPIIDKYRLELEEYLMSDPKLNRRAINLGIIEQKDRVVINWNSNAQKKELIPLIFPELTDVKKATLRKHLNTPGLSLEQIEILYPVVEEGNFDNLQDWLVKHHYEYLKEHDYLIPKGSITINWGSDKQVLPLFTAIHPKLTSLKKEALALVPHPIVESFQSYTSAMKLSTSFGEGFLEKNLEPDTKVRTRFNQILETGRISSATPKYWAVAA